MHKRIMRRWLRLCAPLRAYAFAASAIAALCTWHNAAIRLRKRAMFSQQLQLQLRAYARFFRDLIFRIGFLCASRFICDIPKKCARNGATFLFFLTP